MSSSSTHDDSGAEEVKVAIRMRPLNAKDGGTIEAARVWRVLSKLNSIAQTTTSGKPLPERIRGRNFFTFDKTFGERSTTEEVYSDVAQEITQSVVSGINGTIFAYGQTSSGKTFTMQGAGTIEDGAHNQGGGIVHMAARDIFSHVRNDTERVYVIRVSFVEIYMEEVFDLLVTTRDNQKSVLSIREDPRRGVFVNATENIVTDFESLLRTLFAGEKNRSFASTEMNERSSRSHTIFRVTVESRKKADPREDEGEDEEEGEEYDDDEDKSTSSRDNEDGPVRIATLNLVDLAGSESVRHTGATGERQKEGGLINKSLLSLSRVISALGSSSKPHINFRDSKLTRLLQPSLSGNARMAIICCATPSNSYLEETRSTLAFAQRAKLVKTRAQINEVLDDRSLIKKLQKELALAKRTGGGEVTIARMSALEKEAAEAKSAAKMADEKLAKLKVTILNGNFLVSETNMRKRQLLSTTDQSSTIAFSPENVDSKKKRRVSDGLLLSQRYYSSKAPLNNVSNVQVLSTPKNSTNGLFEKKFQSASKSSSIHSSSTSDQFEINLLKEALIAKRVENKALNSELSDCNKEKEEQVSIGLREKEEFNVRKTSLENELDVQRNHTQNQNKMLSQLEEEINNLRKMLLEERQQKENQVLQLEMEIQNVNSEKVKISSELAQQQDSSNQVMSTNHSLQQQMTQLSSVVPLLKQKVEDSQNNAKGLEIERAMAEATASHMSVAEDEVISKVGTLVAEIGDLKSALERADSENDDLFAVNQKQEEHTIHLSNVVCQLKKEIEAITNISDKIELQRQITDATAADMSTAEDTALSQVQDLVNELSSLQNHLNEADAQNDLLECMNESLEEKNKIISSAVSHLKKEIVTIQDANENLEIQRSVHAATASEMSAAEDAALLQLQGLVAELVRMQNHLVEADNRNFDLASNNQKLADQVTSLSTLVSQLKRDINKSLSTKEDLEIEGALIEATATEMSTAEDVALLQVQSLMTELGRVQTQLMEAYDGNNELVAMNKKLEEQMSSLSSLVSQLKEDIVSGKDVSEDLDMQRALADAAATEMSTAEDEALVQVQGLVTELGRVQSQLTEANADNEDLKNQLNSLALVISQLKGDIVNGQDVSEELDMQRALAEGSSVEMSVAEDAALAQIQALVVELQKVQVQLDAAQTENDDLGVQNEKLDNQLSSLSSLVSQLKEDIASGKDVSEDLDVQRALADAAATEMSTAEDEALVQVQGLVTELSKVQHELNEANGEIENLTCINTDLKDALNDISYSLSSAKDESQSNLIELNKKCIELTQSIDSMRDAHAKEIALLKDELLAEKERTKEFSIAKKSLVHVLSGSETECKELKTQLCRASIELQAANAACEEKKNEISSLTAKLCSLEDENMNLSSDLKNDNVQLQSAASELSLLRSERDELLEKLEKESQNHMSSSRQLTTARSELQDSKMLLDIEKQKLSDAYKELALKEETIKDLQNKPADDAQDQKLQSLESEVVELKQLLASAIEREEKARAIAIAADEELEEKEREHEEMVKYAADRDAHAKDLENEVLRLEAQSSLTSNKEIEELEKELELVLDEKETIERERNNEALLHAQELKQLQQQAGEEQRALVQQAEVKIQQLRNELDDMGMKMKRLEGDAKASRQELAMVEGVINSEKKDIEELKSAKLFIEQKLVEANQTSTNLSTQLKKLRHEYDEYRNHEKLMMESLKSSFEKKLASSKEELQAVKQSYFNEEAKTKSILRNSSKYEDEIDRLQQDIQCMGVLMEEKTCEVGKLKEQIATVRVLLSRTEAENFECKQNLEDNKERMKKMKERTKLELLEVSKKYKDTLTQQEQALAKNQEQHKLLQSENEELKEKLKSKEARMKKLETKRLTKDQVANIQKIMNERKQLQGEVRSMKEKIEALENERNEYEDEVRSMKEEVEKLRIALSSKENDQNYLIDEKHLQEMQKKNEVLESKLRKYMVHSEHLENECRVLKEENNTIPQLQVELKNVNLELERVNSISNVEAEKFLEKVKDLNEVLKAKDHEHLKQTARIDELKEKYSRQKQLNHNLKKSSQELEYEKNRQISYLENESLQYLGELKHIKKEVQSLKAQRRVLEIDDEPTEDLGSIVNNLNKLQSVRVNEDKENCPNQSESLPKAHSSRKERRVGLGTSVNNDDETGECKQS